LRLRAVLAFSGAHQQNSAGAYFLLVTFYLKICTSKILDAPAKFKMHQQHHY